MSKFMRFVDKIEDFGDGCWNWRGSISPNGYGRFTDENGNITYAHRVMAEMVGIDTSNQVNHICDNPACVAPHHLVAGNAKINALDRDSRGRNGTTGRNPRKLTDEDRAEIKRLNFNGICTQKELAEMYNVSILAIQAALKKRL